MSFLNQVAAAQAAAQTDRAQTAALTMKEVVEHALARGSASGADTANAVQRIEEYLNIPLPLLVADLAWFDETFPRARRPGQFPGRERGFWKNRDAYNRWRQKVRREIEHATGAVAARKERDAQADGWSDLLMALDTLWKGRMIHSGEIGAVRGLADVARRRHVEPHSLTGDTLREFHDSAKLASGRTTISKGVKALRRCLVHPSVARLLPPSIDFTVERRRASNDLPKHVSTWINELLETSERNHRAFDPISNTYVDGWDETTRSTNRSALRSYVWSASQGGVLDLDDDLSLESVFGADTFYAVVRYWIDRSTATEAISARSAYQYSQSIATVVGRCGGDVSHIVASCNTNPFLRKGRAEGNGMSKKTIAFCRPLVKDKARRRKFLLQHKEYRLRAEDLLATDKPISGQRLSDIRRFGACAAFAAIETGAAPLRVTNCCRLRIFGPEQNFFSPRGRNRHYLMTLDPNELKVPDPDTPPIKLRYGLQDRAETLDWYLEAIRPLFPFANPEWCGSSEDEPIRNVRFGIRKNGELFLPSCHLFTAVGSAGHLVSRVMYRWLTESSETIGLSMTPHNFRHGIATILMSRSLGNARKVATFLGNTPETVLRNYAWIDSEAVIEDAQDELLAEVR